MLCSVGVLLCTKLYDVIIETDTLMEHMNCDLIHGTFTLNLRHLFRTSVLNGVVFSCGKVNYLSDLSVVVCCEYTSVICYGVYSMVQKHSLLVSYWLISTVSADRITLFCFLLTGYKHPINYMLRPVPKCNNFGL